MDPWLESGEWQGFHDTLIIKTVEVLQPQLRVRGYYAKPGERVWLSRSRGITPDIAMVRAASPAPNQQQPLAVMEADEPLRIAHMEWEVHEGFVDIYRTQTHELVAGIEFVSPTNKTNSKGRRLYRQKQRDFKAANVHLIEIDLIRRGPHVLDIPEEVVEELRPWEYFVNLVRRGSEDFEVYPLRLRTPLPRIRIPLLAEDEDAVLDLQDVFNRSFDISPYPDILNYEVDPPPPELSPEDAAWADELLKSKGLRQ
jgi:hypothetical protein